jgi:TetR/AcrR family fatty acid metabolism transcriptional regulator
MPKKERRDPAGYEAKRKQILKAATRVFAQKGYDGSRVGDIATEAGIAYGLIYHYFDNKPAILNAIFEGAWGVTTKVIEGIAASDASLREKLSSVAGFLLEAWKLEPNTVEVVMIEVLRSPRFMEAGKLQAYQRIFALLETILDSHRGELRDDVEPSVAAVLFGGSLEILLTGFVARDFLRAQGFAPETTRDALIDTFLGGVTRRA